MKTISEATAALLRYISKDLKSYGGKSMELPIHLLFEKLISSP